MNTILSLDPWIGYTLLGVILTYTLVLGGWTAARAGRSPLWGLLLLIPYLNVLFLWGLAYAHWPSFERRSNHTAPEDAPSSPPPPADDRAEAS